MTEETTQTENNQGINISVEQILAAILNTIGATTVPLENLIFNYGSKQIAVTQNEDKSVVFDLVDIQAEASEDSTETAE